MTLVSLNWWELDVEETVPQQESGTAEPDRILASPDTGC